MGVRRVNCWYSSRPSSTPIRSPCSLMIYRRVDMLYLRLPKECCRALSTRSSEDSRSPCVSAINPWTGRRQGPIRVTPYHPYAGKHRGCLLEIDRDGVVFRCRFRLLAHGLSLGHSLVVMPDTNREHPVQLQEQCEGLWTLPLNSMESSMHAPVRVRPGSPSHHGRSRRRAAQREAHSPRRRREPAGTDHSCRGSGPLESRWLPLRGETRVALGSPPSWLGVAVSSAARGSRLGKTPSGVAGTPSRPRSTNVLTVPSCSRAAHGLRSSSAAWAKDCDRGATVLLMLVTGA